MLYDSTVPRKETWNYNEKEAKASGHYFANGFEIIDYLFSR
jgi:2,3-bisphosphoglycerate-independent phosphoglycerate mutase